MTKISRSLIPVLALGAVAAAAFTTSIQAQGNQPPDTPAVTVRGQVYTPRSILARNMGTEADQTTPFTPHKIVGNVYYVGTRTLSAFLITTPDGHILMNTTYERNVAGIQKSVEQLGFKFSDIKIILGNHAHRDHIEGDALAKQLTGAQVVSIAEDVDALKAMKAGDKEHPLDRTIRDGDTVALGGTVLTAHLTAGHTAGCTAWTARVQDGGRAYNVLFFCSLRAPGNLTPQVVANFERSFKVVRGLPCDVPLGDHPAQYRMLEKFAALKPGAPNPFVDPANCFLEAEVQEAMFRAGLAEQKQGAPAK